MPREEDIAWKFVIRLEGKRWRCRYCQKEFSGNVTRVRSHLLKQLKGGISICKNAPERISELMDWLYNQDRNKDDIAWKFVDRLGNNKWRCHYCREEFCGDLAGVKGHLLEVPNEGIISICAEVPDPVRTLMLSLLDEGAEEESREANGQSSTEPQSHDMPTQAEVVTEEESREANVQISTEPQTHDMPTQAEVVAEEESREANVQFSTEPPWTLPSPEFFSPDFVAHMEQFIEETYIGLNSDQQSQAERQFHQSSTKPLLVQSSRGESISCSEEEELYLRDSPYPKETQTNDQHTPAGASSSHYGQLPAVGNSNCLQDCNQHSQLQTPMDINPSIASQRTIDSHIIGATIVDSQVPEAAANTTSPSSSQDMNTGYPIRNERSIYANPEEIRNLKRKVEELNYKEADINEQMGIESAASSVRKKPRILVQKWLKETERARNNTQIIGQANAETLPPKEQVETWTRELEELIERTLPQTLLIEARDAKGDAFLERKLTGEAIHRNIELIWGRLKENHVCKLGIYGMAGVGKTTIMMHIHNRLLKDATFDGVLFITVSQDSSIYKLQSDIWKALKFGVMEDEHEMKRAAMLMKHLERKKNCVLILDDVWQHFKLQDVGITDRAGLKVVLTTRVSEVCSRMDCEEIEIQPLGEEEAWKLFVEELGPKPLTDIRVEKVARKIANRCAGLPLAINTMASSMRGETNFCVWQDTLNKLERSHTEHTEMGDKVFPVLALSYERLSDPQVKECFLFCALFPEDESIKQMQLIEYFIDEGFLGESYTREEQYYRGLAIVDMLRNARLLEVNYGRVRVHDLIRHMALHIMSTACMVKAGEGLRIMPNGEYWTKDLEKVSLMRGWIEDILPDMSPNCPRLSTLLLNGSLQLENMQLQDSFFMKLRGLKVLNLSGCAIRKLPDSVSELANLKALLLRNCRLLDRTPYLGKLKSLRKLDANGCASLLVVEGLEELRNLRYLDLSETGIERLLEGTLRRMVNLQYLKIAGTVEAEEVMQLKSLERLDCNFGNDDFNKYVRFMQRSGRHDYRLIVDQEKSLWFVTAYVYSDPKNFPKIKIKDDDDYHDYSKYVQIRSCNHAMARVGEERYNDSILIPRDAEFIMMRNWRGMTNLSGGDLLRCLRKLEITECDNLVVLCGGAGEDEEVCNTQDSPAPLFPSLETLEIGRCSKLKYLFGHEYRFSVPLLREVFIYQCEGIEGMTTSVASPPQLGGPAFPKLEHIYVENCGNMKRVVGSEWLPHFSNLMRIAIKDCNNIRELLPRECLLHLSNLEHIKVSSCEEIEEIISGGGENHRGSAPLNTPSSSLPSPSSPLKLKILVLYQLPQLKSIGEGALTFIPGAIVSVHDCPQLRSVPPYMSRRVQVGEFLQIQKDELRRLLDMSMRDQAGESLQNQEDVLRRIDEFLQIQEDVLMKHGEFLPNQENVLRRLSDFLRIREDELRTPDRFLKIQKDLLKSLRESLQIKEDELGRLLPEDELGRLLPEDDVLGRLLQEDDVLRRLLQIQEDELRTPGEFLRIGEDLLGIVHESSRFCRNELRRLLDIGLEEDESRRPDEFLGIEEFLRIQKDGLRRLCTFLQM